MTRAHTARAWHALTAAIALASVLTELVMVANGHNPLLAADIPPAPTRVLRFFWTNAGLHWVVPALAIVGWLAFGPRPRIDENALLLALVWPALYVAYTLGHGAASDWYPYPFVDVARLGYVTVVRNGVGMVVLMAGVASIYRVGDHRLPTARDRLGALVIQKPGSRPSA
jgi:hypothetical protein